MKRINEKTKTHGQELILDLFGSDFKIITSKKKILEYLKKICKIIKIRPFGKSQIKRFGKESRWGEGYSFFQFIEESSISGHFIEGENIAYINIFSCKPFDAKIAKDFTKNFFKAKKIKSRFLIR